MRCTRHCGVILVIATDNVAGIVDIVGHGKNRSRDVDRDAHTCAQEEPITLAGYRILPGTHNVAEFIDSQRSK